MQATYFQQKKKIGDVLHRACGQMSDQAIERNSWVAVRLKQTSMLTGQIGGWVGLLPNAPPRGVVIPTYKPNLVRHRVPEIQRAVCWRLDREVNLGWDVVNHLQLESRRETRRSEINIPT